MASILSFWLIQVSGDIYIYSETLKFFNIIFQRFFLVVTLKLNYMNSSNKNGFSGMTDKFFFWTFWLKFTLIRTKHGSMTLELFLFIWNYFIEKNKVTEWLSQVCDSSSIIDLLILNNDELLQINSISIWFFRQLSFIVWAQDVIPLNSYIAYCHGLHLQGSHLFVCCVWEKQHPVDTGAH